jgi:glucose-6-phosphate 1-dehydrogenase
MESSGNKLTDATVIVVLGASGDLAKKKTFPAIFALYQQGLLPKDVKIVGYARTSESMCSVADRRNGRGRILQALDIWLRP